MIIPSIVVNSLTNNQIVGQGYVLSGYIKGNFFLVSSVRVIVDDKLTQNVVPNGNTWSITVDTANLGIHQNKISAIGTDGKIYPALSISVDQYYIPLYHIPLAENEVMVIYDFAGTYDPYEWGVVPFIYGNVSAFIKGAYNWNACTNGGITIAGTGPQVLSYDSKSGYFYKILTIPDNSDYSIQFIPANYSTSGWSDLVNNFGNSYGKLNSATDFDFLQIKNKKIAGIIDINDVYITAKNLYTGAFFISQDSKRIYINVGDHTGWRLQLVGGIIEPMTVMLVCKNVPEVIPIPSHEGVTNIGVTNNIINMVWLPYLGIVSNTVTGRINTNASPVLAGNVVQIFPNLWVPPLGLKITGKDIANHTLSILLNLPAGTPRGFGYKFANQVDYLWQSGEQRWDAYTALPVYNEGTNYITNNYD